MKTTLSQLRALNPCASGITFADVALPERPFTAAEARDFGVSFDDIVWGIAAIARHDAEFDRRLQGWLDDCACHAWNVSGADYPGTQQSADERARRRDFEQKRLDAAIRAITRYAGRVAWAAANRAAQAAARSAVLTARAAGADLRGSATPVAKAAFERARDDAKAREEQWQFDRLILWFEEDEPQSLALL